MKKGFVLGMMLLLALSACSQKKRRPEMDEGSVKGEIYKSKEMGWSIRIPQGWQVMSKDVLTEKARKGMGQVSEAIGTDIDYSGLKFLISFQKDQANSFQSTSEPFGEGRASWIENNKMVKEALFDTYFYRGILADTTSATVDIDGLRFDLFRVKLFNQQGKIFLNQDIYSRLINGYSFAAILNYNNPNDMKVMEDALLRSKFKNR